MVLKVKRAVHNRIRLIMLMAVPQRVERRLVVQLADPVVGGCSRRQACISGEVEQAFFLAEPNDLVGGNAVLPRRGSCQNYLI
ncbi:hypothetical protein D3C76_1538900 [compost metagenome]